MAKIDGILSKDEILMIQRIAQHYGYSKNEIDALFTLDDTEEPINLSALNPHDRFDCFYTILQLMKVDGRLYGEEIDFCQRTAASMGYDDPVLYHFLLHVKKEASLEEREQFKRYAHKHFDILAAR